jgi:hypothetical protein
MHVCVHYTYVQVREQVCAYMNVQMLAFSADFSNALVSQNDRLALVLSFIALIVQKYKKLHLRSCVPGSAPSADC